MAEEIAVENGRISNFEGLVKQHLPFFDNEVAKRLIGLGAYETSLNAVKRN